MNPKLRPYAWIGLALSGASAVFCLVYFFLYRDFNIAVQVGLGLFVIGLAVFALFDPEKLREIFTGRQMKYGSNMFVFAVAILGILVVFNFLANKYGPKWDFTEDRTNTLSTDTIKIIQALPEKVQALAFFSSNYPTDTAKNLLDNIQQNSAGKFSYEFIDPNADPVRTQQYGIKTDGTIIFLMANRQQEIKTTSEDEAATALVKLVNPIESSVYFLTGHGEHDPTKSGEDGMASAATVLAKKSYTVKTLNLMSNPAIPEDADVIVVAGPQKPVSADEVAILKAFVDAGHSLVVLEDAVPTTQFGDETDPLAAYIQTDWGATLENSLVIDFTSNTPAQPVSASYGNHPIVNRLAGYATVFPSARSISLAQTPPAGVTNTGLVYTADNSYAELDIAALLNNEYQYDAGVDIPGPITVAAAGTNTSNKSRLVVAGSSYFGVDRNFDAYGNGDLLVNMIDWAAENESVINLTPRAKTNRILVAPSTVGLGVIFLISVVAIPVAILVGGIAVWIQRRKRS